MKSVFYFLVVLGIFTSCSHPQLEVKIACVGNSITEGAGLKKQSANSYPVMLDSIFGNGFSVLNCGRSAATMLKNGNLPYWYTNEFSNVFAFQPDIIIIKLGTNDTKPENWNFAKFKIDYQAMIDTFGTIPTKPKIFVCLPVPVYEDKWGINDSILQTGVLPAIRQVAEANHLPLIDLFTALNHHHEYFPDGIHPDEKGAKLMAEAVAKAIVENK